MERFDPREAAVTHHMNNGLTQLQAEHLADATQYDSPALDEYSSALQARSDAGYKKLNPMAEYDFMESFRKMNNKPSLMTTKDFFNEGEQPYFTDPKAPEPSPKYLDAIMKQRAESDKIMSESANARDAKRLADAKAISELPPLEDRFNELTDARAASYKAKKEIADTKSLNELMKTKRMPTEAEFYKMIADPKPKLEIVNPEEGASLVGGMIGAALPIAVHYANQATHGEFNPLDIKSAGEGSDIVPTMERGPVDELYRKKQLQSLREN
jgi:hypothetical protein